eukprot:GHRR01001527.1.p1 GENE.GHRR01001527.1~~GHRR01001527.1.p1  ORF type:complete len:479 (+),score=212.19 GHRR01001527.1:283-1719(+)
MGSQLELTSLQYRLVSSDSTVFAEGFSSPWQRDSDSQAVPWSTVQQVLLMAKDALLAKQCAAEVLLKEVDLAEKAATDDQLLQRAQRAEVDSGLLLEELQALIQAKADVAQQRADLDRANALLMAERDLLCEQLDVSPDNVNLCQAVQRVLAAARHARGLEGQLRLLARCQKELLLQLENSSEEAAQASRHWRACEQVYLDCLEAHGIPKPRLPSPPAAAPAAQQHRLSISSNGSSASNGGAGRSHTYSSSRAAAAGADSSAGSSSMQAQLLQRLSSGHDGAAGGVESTSIGSPASHAHMFPATPPASDFSLAGDHPIRMRRTHSLDSGLDSLTGLLEQLTFGQLGSDDGADVFGHFDHDEDDDTESWMLVDMGPAKVPVQKQPANAAVHGMTGTADTQQFADADSAAGRSTVYDAEQAAGHQHNAAASAAGLSQGDVGEWQGRCGQQQLQQQGDKKLQLVPPGGLWGQSTARLALQT